MRKRGYKKYLKCIDKKKITNTARISCVWDYDGQWVDFNYSYDKDTGYGDYQCCYAVTCQDDQPDDETWEFAKSLAEYMSQKYGLELDISNDFEEGHRIFTKKVFCINVFCLGGEE